MNTFLTAGGVQLNLISQTPPQVIQLVDEYLGCRRFWKHYFTACLASIEEGYLSWVWQANRPWLPHERPHYKPYDYGVGPQPPIALGTRDHILSFLLNVFPADARPQCREVWSMGLTESMSVDRRKTWPTGCQVITLVSAYLGWFYTFEWNWSNQDSWSPCVSAFVYAASRPHCGVNSDIFDGDECNLHLATETIQNSDDEAVQHTSYVNADFDGDDTSLDLAHHLRSFDHQNVDWENVD